MKDCVAYATHFRGKDEWASLVRVPWPQTVEGQAMLPLLTTICEKEWVEADGNWILVQLLAEVCSPTNRWKFLQLLDWWPTFCMQLLDRMSPAGWPNRFFLSVHRIHRVFWSQLCVPFLLISMQYNTFSQSLFKDLKRYHGLALEDILGQSWAHVSCKATCIKNDKLVANWGHGRRSDPLVPGTHWVLKQQPAGMAVSLLVSSRIDHLPMDLCNAFAIQPISFFRCKSKLSQFNSFLWHESSNFSQWLRPPCSHWTQIAVLKS